MSGWLRWYEGTCGDAKFQIIARNVTGALSVTVTVSVTLGVWAALLEDASNAAHRGISVRPISFHTTVLQLDESVFSAILREMERLEMIQTHENKIKITNWNKLQFETDKKDNTNADRQRRWRERKRHRNGTVTAANDTERPDSDSDTDLRALRPARSVACAPDGALAREPISPPAEPKRSAEKQGMSPDLGDDYRSPPQTKSTNVLEPIPDSGTGRRKRTY